MSVKRLTLTDEDYRALCDSLPQGAGYRDLADAAVAFGESRGLQRAAEELRRAAPNEGYVRTCMLAMADRFDREREGADGK